jgi:hypothetical protein
MAAATSTEALSHLLKEAAEAIETIHEDSEGAKLWNEAVCPVCVGALPLSHSLCCRIGSALAEAEKAP